MKFFKKGNKSIKSEKTDDFKTFENHYFTGHGMIRGRGEEDISVWDRLEGDELETAKEMIIDNLLTYDKAYVRAVSIFRDERAIDKLKQIADSGPNIYIKTYAAKTLYDWIGYDKYFSLAEEAMTTGGEFTKTELGYWTQGLREKEATKLFMIGLTDKSSFVRFSAFNSLQRYYKAKRESLQEGKYYTADEIFNDKDLFEKRLLELESKIKEWKNNSAQHAV